MLKRTEVIVVSALLTLIVYTLSLSVLALVQTSRTVPNTGTIKAIGVGVYWDNGCTTPVPSINWTIVEPGSNNSRTVYIRNEGSTAANLSMTVPKSSWNPLNASSYMTLKWDYNNQTLNVNQVIPVKFTLSVLDSIAGITNFSFDIIITASE